MKKIVVIFYGLAIIGALMLQSCEDGPILPNGNGNNNVDTIWVDDSLGNDDGDIDPADSTEWNGGGGDFGNGEDSTNIENEPGDSLGGN